MCCGTGSRLTTQDWTISATTCPSTDTMPAAGVSVSVAESPFTATRS